MMSMLMMMMIMLMPLLIMLMMLMLMIWSPVRQGEPSWCSHPSSPPNVKQDLIPTLVLQLKYLMSYIQRMFTSSLLTIALSSDALSVLCGRGLRATPEEVAILPTLSPLHCYSCSSSSHSPLSHPVVTSFLEAIKLVVNGRQGPLVHFPVKPAMAPSPLASTPSHVNVSSADLKRWVVMQLKNIEHMARSRTELSFSSLPA